LAQRQGESGEIFCCTAVSLGRVRVATQGRPLPEFEQQRCDRGIIHGWGFVG
jgi:hypothetical protein